MLFQHLHRTEKEHSYLPELLEIDTGCVWKGWLALSMAHGVPAPCKRMVPSHKSCTQFHLSRQTLSDGSTQSAATREILNRQVWQTRYAWRPLELCMHSSTWKLPWVQNHMQHLPCSSGQILIYCCLCDGLESSANCSDIWSFDVSIPQRSLGSTAIS